jgi:hypothetical protein
VDQHGPKQGFSICTGSAELPGLQRATLPNADAGTGRLAAYQINAGATLSAGNDPEMMRFKNGVSSKTLNGLGK